MTVDKNYTPLPTQRLAPIKVAAADWLNLSANSKERVLRLKGIPGQAINVNRIGGRPLSDVNVVLRTRVKDTRGTVVNDEEVVESTALDEFGDFAEAGPLATESLLWQVDNNSGTDYTQASANDPYQTFINFTVHSPTVVEKVERGIPLTGSERDVAEKFNIFNRDNLGVPARKDPTVKPNMEGKVVVDSEASVKTVDISESGSSNSVNLAQEKGLRDRGLVAYVTGLRINSENYTFGDNLKVSFIRNETDNFYRLGTKGLPGMASDYKADLHIPFTKRMDVEVFADNAVNNVDFHLEYKLVKRTLLEKALYNLRDEVSRGDGLDRDRQRIFDKLRTRLQAGVSIQEVLDRVQFAQGAKA